MQEAHHSGKEEQGEHLYFLDLSMSVDEVQRDIRGNEKDIERLLNEARQSLQIDKISPVV
jgi:hypothetical protein